MRSVTATALLVVPLGLAGCAGSGDKSGPASETVTPATSSAAGTASAAACPVEPVKVVVSVDQWGKIVSDLGGSCAQVNTILASSSVDPHDYEPAPADATAFEGAQLVVVNGAHYDEWASKLAASSAPGAPVINAAELGVGLPDVIPGNPHVWYDPATVVKVADAVTAALGERAPGAKDYFEQRRSEFAAELQPYDDLIAKIRTAAGKAPKSYAATESVFDDLAAAVGLQDRTPSGYKVAVGNEGDPSPADLDAFLKLLSSKGIDVLIYNTQTEGAVPEKIRAAAGSAGVPVVEITETVAPGAKSFESWQVDQLTALAKALGVTG